MKKALSDAGRACGKTFGVINSAHDILRRPAEAGLHVFADEMYRALHAQAHIIGGAGCKMRGQAAYCSGGSSSLLPLASSISVTAIRISARRLRSGASSIACFSAEP